MAVRLLELRHDLLWSALAVKGVRDTARAAEST